MAEPRLVLPNNELSLPDGVETEFKNESGIQPVEYKCLVKPFRIHETDEVLRSAKEAGIELSEATSDREEQSQCIALLVAVGGNAFEDWKGQIPKVGDRILMAKYAGIKTPGIDNYMYRLVNDKDISACLFDLEGEDDS